MAPDGLPDGDYRMRVEVSLEADWNAAWPACSEGDPSCAHPTFPDEHVELQSYGHDLLGQPSLVWSAPFTLDGKARAAVADMFEGMGAWDGATGALAPPDGTISTTVDGSGSRRLISVDDGDGAGAWRVKVSTSGCGGGLCTAPAAPTALALAPSDTSIAVSFDAPAGPVRPARYEVRYRVGAALTNANFATATPGDMPPAPGPAGAPQSFSLEGLHADSLISVGIRAVAACGAPSPTVFAAANTQPAHFAVLHGCFVATAAWGSPLEAEVESLRGFRDGRLLPSALGRLAVAAYYGLGPAAARAIAGDGRLRAGARALLAPLVALARR
jgi:hypothetical protein